MADVPNLPGVPLPLTGYNGQTSSVRATADGVASLGGPGPQWGIFLNGALVVTADTVTDFSFHREWVIADYPLERGAFESYDKVALPYQITIRFISGKNESNRQTLLSSIQAIEGDYNLYDVVTPTAVYTSCNVKSSEYRRTPQSGLGILQVDVKLQWIRVAGGTSGSTVNPSIANQSNNGAVQGVAALQSQLTAGLGTNFGATRSWFTN